MIGFAAERLMELEVDGLTGATWLTAVPIEQGVKEVGLFGNQNTVCKPTTPKWRTTVDRLEERSATA